MSSRFRFPIIVAEATLLATALWFVLLFMMFSIFGLKSNLGSLAIEILVVLALVLVPIAVAVLWMFPKLTALYPRREARAVATAFGVFSPVAWGAGIAVGGMVGGGYADHLAGSRALMAAGIFLGTAMVATVLMLAACALVLRVTRLAESAEQSAGLAHGNSPQNKTD